MKTLSEKLRACFAGMLMLGALGVTTSALGTTVGADPLSCTLDTNGGTAVNEFVVNSLADTATGDCEIIGPVCTLRDAILAANVDSSQSLITFSVAGTITPGTALPDITHPVCIDGENPALGWAPATNLDPPDRAATLVIELDGDGISFPDPESTTEVPLPNLEFASGLVIRTSNSTVKGLAIYRFKNDPDVRASSDADTGGFGIYVSGRTADQGEEPVLIPVSNNTIKGNHIGLPLSGVAPSQETEGRVCVNNCIGNTFGGIQLNRSRDDLVGGLNPASRNVLSNNGFTLAAGSSNSGFSTDRYTVAVEVLGNYVGIDANGANIHGNSGHGLSLEASRGNQFSARVEKNIVKNHRFNGVRLLFSTSCVVKDNITSDNRLAGFFFIGSDGCDVTGNEIRDNQIGLRVALAQIEQLPFTIENNFITGNDVAGIGLFALSTDLMIRGNTVTFNGFGELPDIPNTFGGGIVAENTNSRGSSGPVLGNSFLENTIHSNKGLGIDLSAVRSLRGRGAPGENIPLGDGVTFNDLFDLDLMDPDDPSNPGANNLQNFPVLDSAVGGDGEAVVDFALNSKPNSAYRIEFFGNLNQEAQTQHGEGEHFIGTMNVVTDGVGDTLDQFRCGPTEDIACGDVMSPPNIQGLFVSATATFATDVVCFEDEENKKAFVPQCNNPAGATDTAGNLFCENGGVLSCEISGHGSKQVVTATCSEGATPICLGSTSEFSENIKFKDRNVDDGDSL